MFHEDNNSTKLLNMEDVIVQKVENAGNELYAYMMLSRKMHKCPCCSMLIWIPVRTMRDPPPTSAMCRHSASSSGKCTADWYDGTPQPL